MKNRKDLLKILLPLLTLLLSLLGINFYQGGGGQPNLKTSKEPSNNLSI